MATGDEIGAKSGEHTDNANGFRHGGSGSATKPAAGDEGGVWSEGPEVWTGGRGQSDGE
jgi:hypothetical protein